MRSTCSQSSGSTAYITGNRVAVADKMTDDQTRLARRSMSGRNTVSKPSNGRNAQSWKT